MSYTFPEKDAPYEKKDPEEFEHFVSLDKSRASCTRKNFPWKCFFNPSEDGVVHMFYRQGFGFMIPVTELGHFEVDKISDDDLGTMIMFRN